MLALFDRLLDLVVTKQLPALLDHLEILASKLTGEEGETAVDRVRTVRLYFDFAQREIA